MSMGAAYGSLSLLVWGSAATALALAALAGLLALWLVLRKSLRDAGRGPRAGREHPPALLATVQAVIEQLREQEKEAARLYQLERERARSTARLSDAVIRNMPAGLLLVGRATRQQQRLRENLLLRQKYAARCGFPRIVGEHASMKKLARDVQRLAATNSTVLLLGESGMGKELIARAIHHLSARRDAPFVAVNCAAIPEGLVENELFGHERGAYTGASARKLRKIELAHAGTLFLDEIADLPLATQGKLLRVVEERAFERVGGIGLIEVDVRLLAATNKDLEAAVAAKTFREDLYFRIASLPLRLPALRERGKDVLLLAEYFLDRYRRELRKPTLRLTDAARAPGCLPLVRQCPRVGQRRRARRHPLDRRDD